MEIKSFIISTRTITKTAFIALIILLAYLIRDVIALTFVSFILALALEPYVEFLTDRKIPRSISVVSVILVVLSLFFGLLSIALVPFIREFQVLISRTPNYLDMILNVPFLNGYKDQYMAGLGTQVSQLSSNLLQLTIDTVSGILSLVIVVTFTIYMLLEINTIRSNLLKIFHKNDRKKIQKTFRAVELKLGGWIRGQIVLMLIVGFLTFLGLSILGIDYALALAVIAGLLEVVSMIGPTISVIPAAIVGFAVSPAMGFGVIGLYILIQQLENHLIVPKVMQRAVGQSPILTIFAFLVGAQLFGFVGVLLAVPFTIVVTETLKNMSSE